MGSTLGQRIYLVTVLGGSPRQLSLSQARSQGSDVVGKNNGTPRFSGNCLLHTYRGQQ
jgi:hypothetical protein